MKTRNKTVPDGAGTIREPSGNNEPIEVMGHAAIARSGRGYDVASSCGPLRVSLYVPSHEHAVGAAMAFDAILEQLDRAGVIRWQREGQTADPESGCRHAECEW